VLATAQPLQSDLLVCDPDRDAPRWHGALHLARPWRARARDGQIYRDAAAL